jgi:hypothetical protein
LLKLLGIMSKGEMKCLGSKNHLKKKYGHGLKLELMIENFGTILFLPLYFLNKHLQINFIFYFQHLLSAQSLTCRCWRCGEPSVAQIRQESHSGSEDPRKGKWNRGLQPSCNDTALQGLASVTFLFHETFLSCSSFL